MDLLWAPLGPTSWRTPRGEVLHKLGLGREHLLNFEIGQALDHECWISAASSHPYGNGAQD
eukprot:308428-Pyramimonas_sp.AAC.1